MACRNQAPLPCWNGMTDDAHIFCAPDSSQRECVGRMTRSTSDKCRNCEK